MLNAGQELVYRIRAKADRAGVHMFRTEVTCPTLGTKLATDETTRFYLDDSIEPDEAVAEAQEPTASFRDEDGGEFVDDTPVESEPVEDPSIDEQFESQEPQPE